MNAFIVLLLITFVISLAQAIARRVRGFRSGARVVEAGEGRAQQFVNRLRDRLWIFVATIVVLILLLTSFSVVDAGQVGVKSLFGKVSDEVLASGLHIENPLVRVHRFDTKTQNYTMSAVQDEGQKSGDDAIRVLSSDGLEITLDVTVLYRVEPEAAPKILREVGDKYQDTVVRPVVRTRIRDAAVYYQAVDMYSTKREELQERIFKSIAEDFEQRGLVLEQLLIRNITLPESVKTAIEAKINAEQESQKYDFLLQKEHKEAERKRIEAEGQRDAQRIVNESLTDKYLYYQYISQLKDRQGTIYVPTNPATGLPQFKNLGN